MKDFILKLHKKDTYLNKNDIVYDLPITNAFGIISYTFYNGSISNELESDFLLKDGRLILKGYAKTYSRLEEISILVINYKEIRDYKLLFPNILKENNELAQRLGQYYYEGEKSFENKAWLTYSLMCAAIYEGLLYFTNTQDKSFFERIEKAYNTNIIDENEKEIMHTAREYRNLVHAEKYTKEYVSRKSAVDMRTTMDCLVHRLG
ncbi:DUF4145 domain-containing protein [Romboutsia sp.]|uniref:DUF4145 domain-containing protein n=1 Tax=Romboutsia sp. TaxID=1965302 RepID=UPI003F3174FE